ncbi:hypothetical protein SeLEV6574_g03246 [Synchytrium endobioticum]|uniref:Uncharacterized protein n=1 Tax=Synchytrium endobioticum TaxID=286115 RepID=A0A507D4H6_9FUNG|nr:hypothetical protein SeLEV6574_g03246 [Synchytrium endobioticum]
MRLNADDLVVLAVVSGNDYASNIPGKAIVTNVKIFQKIKEKGDFSKEEILKKYLQLCQSDRKFDVAKGVFFNFDEGKVLDPLDRSKGLEKREARAALVEALWGANFLRNVSWPDSSIKIPMLTMLTKKVAVDIDTVFSNKIVGMPPLLKERVVEVVGEEGKQAIEEIEAWVDESLEDDPPSPPPPVQVFYKINRLLPGPYRWSIVSHTSFGNGYVTMSEEYLFDLLFDIPKEVARAAFMKNPSKGRLLEEVFLLPPEMLAKSRYVMDDSPRRYVRTPCFKTKGLVLSLLWIDTTSKPSPPDRKVEDAINLPNMFSNKSLQSIHKNAWPSPQNPSANPKGVIDWLEADKPEAICTAERECTKSDQETRAVFLRHFLTTYDMARAYYSTKKYKRKRWDADKAKRGELDRVLEGIVIMVGASMGHKLSGGKQVIVAIGMGDFSSTKSRHVMFIRGYLEHDERPTYLKPPSKDKNTPMKRKADEGGTSRGGPSKSRKTR